MLMEHKMPLNRYKKIIALGTNEGQQEPYDIL